MNNVDSSYFTLLWDIKNNGRVKKNRTGVDTMGVFGAQARFNVSCDAFPILTTKKIFFKAIVHELLWFIKGDTNIKYLVDNGVHIWDGDCYRKYKNTPIYELKEHEYFHGKGDSDNIQGQEVRKFTQEEFIQKIKSCPPYNPIGNWDEARFAIEWGELGKGTYGNLWRGFPCHDDTQIDPQVKFVDQLGEAIDKLKNNPEDRRIIVSAWHPDLVKTCALPPCHCLFHFNTEELTLSERIDLDVIQRKAKNEIPLQRLCFDEDFYEVKYHKLLDEAGIPRRRLNLLLYQRSCDTFLGVPFNITSYSLLLAMVAHCVGMEPGTFVHTYGDLHIYSNHLDQVNEQLKREPRKLPGLWLNPRQRDLFDFQFEDIMLINYDPHPAIKAEVAV